MGSRKAVENRSGLRTQDSGLRTQDSGLRTQSSESRSLSRINFAGHQHRRSRQSQTRHPRGIVWNSHAGRGELRGWNRADPVETGRTLILAAGKVRDARLPGAHTSAWQIADRFEAGIRRFATPLHQLAGIAKAARSRLSASWQSHACSPPRRPARTFPANGAHPAGSPARRAPALAYRIVSCP